MKRFESLRFKCETITSTLAAVALACGGVAFSQPTITDLGTFPGGQVSSALRVSGDGSVVVGYAPASGATAGMENLSVLPGSGSSSAPDDIFNLGTLGGTNSNGYAINDAGQVAGVSLRIGDATGHAFRYSGTPGSGGAMVDLGTLGGEGSEAFGINDAGQVAGASSTTGGPPHAFRYTGTPGSGGAMADLGTLGGTDSYGYGINDAGQVTGLSSTTGGPPHAFRYTGTPGSGGAMVDLGTLGGTYSWGSAINNAGQVTGWSPPTTGADIHAFLYTGTPGLGGAMVDLGTLGGEISAGIAINDAGQVAGNSNPTGSGYHHAFRYTGTPGSGGAMVDLGTLGGTSSYSLGINDAGFVVGYAEQSAAAAGGSLVATLWQTDAANTAVDLEAWLDATNPTLGAFWQLTVAQDINNNGLITGWGVYDDGPGGLSDGFRAYILDASSLVPEPASAVMLVLGAIGVLARTRCEKIWNRRDPRDG